MAFSAVTRPEWMPVVLPRLRTRRGPGRLLLAVLVLYALALQIVLGGMAMVIGVALAHKGIRRALRHAPRWAFPAGLGR